MSTHSKPVYRPLPEQHKPDTIDAISVPMHLPTALGDWVHMAIVETENVPDPRNLADMLNAVKEHSILVYNGKGFEGDLSQTPLTDFISDGEENPALVRIHSLCRFGDALHGQNCDCGPQLFAGMRTIMENGSGVIMYMEQEGRNIGLAGKTAANRLEQVGECDTTQTFQAMGLQKSDYRHYDVVADALKMLGITHVRLMSNNPLKIAGLENNGLIVTPAAIEMIPTEHSQSYLQAKQVGMGHTLSFNPVNDNGHAQVIHMIKALMPHLKPHHMESLREIIRHENGGEDPIFNSGVDVVERPLTTMNASSITNEND